MSGNKGLTKTALSLAMLAVLSACSSGGTSVTPEGDDGYGSVSGTAAKGIIRSGLVTLVELDSSGNVLQTLGTTQSDSNGHYAIDVGDAYKGGPLMVTIEADDDSQMLCDYHSDAADACEFGTAVALQSGFAMSAVLAAASEGEAVTLPITPLTHMAAVRARNSGTVNAEAVTNAISEVSQIVGVDINKVEPIDLTVSGRSDAASADEKVYAAFIAGIGRIAAENTGGLNQGLDAIGQAFADGKLDSADSGISVDQIIAKVTDESGKSGLGADSAVSVLEQRVVDGSFDPEPLDVPIGDVAQGKALMSDMRTWLTSMADYEAPLMDFGSDLELAGEFLDGNAETLLGVFTEVIDAIGTRLEEAETPFGNHTVTVQGSELSVTVSATGTDGGVMISLPTSRVGEAGVSVATTISTSVPQAALAGEDFSLNNLTLKVSGLVSNNDTSITLKQADLVIKASGALQFSDSGEPDTSKLTGATLLGAVEITQLVAVDDSASPIQLAFNGDVDLELVKLTNGGEYLPLSLDHAALKGSFSSTNGRSLSASASLKMHNATSFDLLALMEHDDWVWVEDYSPTDVFGLSARVSDLIGDSSGTVYYSSWDDQTCTNSETLDADQQSIWGNWACTSGDALGVTALIEAKVAEQLSGYSDIPYVTASVYRGMEGDVASYSTSYSAEVEMPDYETTNNFLNATATVNIDLALNGVPGASLVLTADRTKLQDAAISAAFIQTSGSASVERFRATVQATDGEPDGNIVFKNSSNVAMTLTPDLTEDTLTGVITTNGNAVGTLESSGNAYIIRWKDGTFETLN